MRHPGQPAYPSPPIGPSPGFLSLLLALMTALAAASQTTPSQDDVDRIQRECLRAYTPEMLAGLTSGAEAEIPAEVEAVPEEQEEFLDQVLMLEKGRFYPFLLEDLLSAFELYLKPGVRFLDLGSGDGRVVFLAALLGADASGIEYDKQMFQTSRRALQALEDLLERDRVHLKRGDFFKSSWSGYDVIFYFDLTSFEQNRLRKKIAAELDPGARLLVGHQRSAFPGLQLETTFESIHVYRQPEMSEHDPTFKDRCYKEVVDLHRFFQDWFNATLEPTEESFARFADVLAPGFTMIGPDAQTTRRAVLLERLRGAYGRWRGPESEEPGTGSIRIENLRLQLIEGPLALVVYDERHEVRGEVRVRRSTALFRLVHGTPNGVEWYHVHETWLP